MYCDSHAHMFFEDFRQDLPEVFRRAHDAGVATIVIPGTTLETSRRAVQMAEEHEGVYACVGFHPHDAGLATEKDFDAIEELSRHPKVVAIGEIGLDYYYDHAPKDRQREVFKKQIAIAQRRDLPIVVHTRDSMDDAIALVTEAVTRNTGWKKGARNGGDVLGSRGVFHCFSGTEAQARTLFSNGYYVSYPGIVTFKKSPVVNTLQAIGYRNILLETDSPFLTPVPFRGKRNEPSHIPLIANKIAELCHVTPSMIAEQTRLNTRHLFSIS